MLVTKHRNSIARIAWYLLNVDTRLADAQRDDFLRFWKSLTEEEKLYFYSIDLKTGMPCVEQVCGHRRL